MKLVQFISCACFSQIDISFTNTKALDKRDNVDKRGGKGLGVEAHHEHAATILTKENGKKRKEKKKKKG